MLAKKGINNNGKFVLLVFPFFMFVKKILIQFIGNACNSIQEPHEKFNLQSVIRIFPGEFIYFSVESNLETLASIKENIY